MTESEMEDFENHLASHLKPMRPDEDHWAKAMKLIKHTIKMQIQKALEAEADRGRAAVDMAYSQGYQAGQGLKG